MNSKADDLYNLLYNELKKRDLSKMPERDLFYQCQQTLKLKEEMRKENRRTEKTEKGKKKVGGVAVLKSFREQK